MEFKLNSHGTMSVINLKICQHRLCDILYMWLVRASTLHAQGNSYLNHKLTVHENQKPLSPERGQRLLLLVIHMNPGVFCNAHNKSHKYVCARENSGL